MTEHEKNYIIRQIKSCMEKVSPSVFGIKRDIIYGALGSLKATIETMTTEEDVIDDWSMSIETEIDKIKQRVLYLEMIALSGGRKDDGDVRTIL